MKHSSLLSVLSATSILVSAGAVSAAENKDMPPETMSEFTKALTEGKVLFDARYRYEYVDQDGLANKANANTIRTRLGYETGKFHDFSALVEMENNSGLGNRPYNDTINGKTRYPIVADPNDTALSRLQLSYTGIPDTNVTVGRQRFSLDNHRFVGDGAWRQNGQSFDAVTLKNQSIKDVSLFYGYANQFNRVFGTDSPVGIWDDTNIHLFNASYSGWKYGRIIGYTYLLDIPDSTSSSSSTYGGRFEGKYPVQDGITGLLNLEYAHQSDYANNPNSFGLNYYNVEPGVTVGSWTLKGQYESIGGNGVSAVQFPLATLHAFDGWADKFLTTPANGLVDANIGVTYIAKSSNQYINGTKAMVVYHDFSAEHTSANYGKEWDALLEQTFEQHYTAGIKFASYNADGLYTDTVKIMPYVQVKF